MNIKIVRTASDIDPAAWQALVPAPRETQAWFLTSEAYFQTTTHLYLSAWDDGQLKAILPLYDKTSPQYYHVTLSYPGITQRLLQRQKFLCIGSRIGFESGIIGDKHYGEALLLEAVTVARSEGADFLAANFSREPLPGWDAYRVGRVFDVHMLKLRGDCYDDFMLAKFRSKRRSGFKREMLRSAPIFRVPLTGNEAMFNTLRSISCDRQGGQNYLEDSFFTHLARTHGDTLILTATGTETEWTGANLVIATEHEFCGMGVGVRDRDESYFNLMVHEPMLRAYATGRKQIDLGPSCDKAKQLRGADPVELSSYLRPISNRCALTVNTIRPLAKRAVRFVPRIRRRLGMKPSV